MNSIGRMNQYARVVLIILVFAGLSEPAGVFQGLTYLTGAFPTYFHKTDSAIELICLVSSLSCLAIANSRFYRPAAILLGSLMFLSVFGLLRFLGPSFPLNVKIIWISVGAIVSCALGLVLWTAIDGGIMTWKQMFFSLALTNLVFCYFYIAQFL